MLRLPQYSDLSFISRLLVSLLLLALSLINPLWSQTLQPNCANRPSASATQRLLNNKQLAKAKRHLQKNVTNYLPIQLHLVGNDDGNFRISADRAITEICNLNAEFEQLDFQFYLPGNINYVNDTDLNAHSFSGGLSNSVITKLSSHKVANTINLFVVDQIEVNFAGYYSSIADVVVMDRDYIDSTNTIIAHELGHFFSLRHTFSGWEGDNLDEGVAAPLTIPGPGGQNVAVEFVDRAKNCDTAGDLFCDTPADYASFVWQASGCDFTLNYLDPDSEALDPDETNHMSYFYFSDCTDYQFSSEQIAVMLADYQTRTELSDLPPPMLTNLEGVAVLQQPINQEEVAFFNQVDFDWEDVAGATSYLLEVFVRIGNNELILEKHITDESAIRLTSLQPNVTYHWRIWAFNATQFCHRDWSEVATFQTGDIFTSVASPPHGLNISIYPNPIRQQRVQLSIQATYAETGKLKISTPAGKIICEQTILVQAGANPISIPLSTKVRGLCFLTFETATIHLADRFLIP